MVRPREQNWPTSNFCFVFWLLKGSTGKSCKREGIERASERKRKYIQEFRHVWHAIPRVQTRPVAVSFRPGTVRYVTLQYGISCLTVFGSGFAVDYFDIQKSFLVSCWRAVVSAPRMSAASNLKCDRLSWRLLCVALVVRPFRWLFDLPVDRSVGILVGRSVYISRAYITKYSFVR